MRDRLIAKASLYLEDSVETRAPHHHAEAMVDTILAELRDLDTETIWAAISPLDMDETWNPDHFTAIIDAVRQGKA